MIFSLILLFCSGAAALVYEVLWLKELGLLFGNTAQASSATLTVFFLGISVGGWFFGERCPKIPRPLAAYGLLEIGVAVSALFYFLIYDFYAVIYGPLYSLAGGNTIVLLTIKVLLSLLLLFPPAFLMGGTLPMMSQYLIKNKNELAKRGTLIYGVNTLGAVSGAILAGFVLPRMLGFTGTYLSAMSINIAVGLAAILTCYISPTGHSATHRPSESVAAGTSNTSTPKRLILFLALTSGFLSLALEVLWTRMFSQLLQNSIYTYSLILSFFLLSLAIGSFISSRLVRLSLPPWVLLSILLAASSVTVGATPAIFNHVSELMRAHTLSAGWFHYLMWASGSLILVIVVPGLILGTIFPYLLKSLEHDDLSPGQNLGRLTAANTCGAIIGSLFSGFFLLPLTGLWVGIKVIAGAYAVLAALIVPRRKYNLYSMSALAALALIVCFLPSSIQVNVEKGEKVLDIIEGSHATVAVIDDNGNIRLKVNNNYTLGDTSDVLRQRLQAQLAIMLHPDPKHVFHLGLGTGITAGASLNYPLESVTVAELLPEVITASQLYYDKYLNGLFDDPRVRVIAEDGRNYLLGTGNTFDLIIGDLFLPWKIGTGSLYTEKHFQTIKTKLNPEGLFVQWLPTYQFSRQEFNCIAKTLLDVFDYVTVWRATFQPYRPTVALVGHMNNDPIDMNRVLRNYRLLSPESNKLPDDFLAATICMYYVGNLSQVPELFEGAPINTDNRPMIEYLAPQTERNQSIGMADFMKGKSAMSFFTTLREQCPIESDPFLTSFSSAHLNSVQAGDELTAYKYASRIDKKTASEHLQIFHTLVPPLLSKVIKGQ